MDQKQLDSRGDATLMMLRAAAIERGMLLSGDDRMGECHAAKGVKRTSACALHMSAFDPKRTLGLIRTREAGCVPFLTRRPVAKH